MTNQSRNQSTNEPNNQSMHASIDKSTNESRKKASMHRRIDEWVNGCMNNCINASNATMDEWTISRNQKVEHILAARRHEFPGQNLKRVNQWLYLNCSRNANLPWSSVANNQMQHTYQRRLISAIWHAGLFGLNWLFVCSQLSGRHWCQPQLCTFTSKLFAIAGISSS